MLYLLAGDFNINLLKINKKPKISEYFDMLTNHSFFPKISLSIKHGTLIDNFVCKLTENTIHITSGILVKKFFSDHQPNFTLLDKFSINNATSKYININKPDSESKKKFKEELQESIKRLNLDIDPNLDPNINYNILHDTIQSAKELHLPSKIVRYNKYKHQQNK